MAKVASGGLFWIVVLAACWIGFGRRAVEHNLIGQLGKYAFGQRDEVVLRLVPAQALQVGDPLYVWSSDSLWSAPIGRVVRVDHSHSRRTDVVETEYAVVMLYTGAPHLTAHDQVYLMSTPRSLAWVIETMLPPEMRHRIGEMIVAAWSEHRALIWSELQPIVEAAVRDSAAVIGEEFALSWQRHQREWAEIADRYRDDYVATSVLPVLRQDIWPLVQREMQPLLEQFGLRLWQRASVFGFTWRYLYDVSPLPQRDLLRREFQRFAEQEAIPILVEFTPALLQAQQRIVEAAAKHPRVRDVIAQGLQTLAQDSHTQQLLLTMLQEAVIENPRLADIWRRSWSTPEAQRAFERIGQALEPSITAIGELLFGNPHNQITPEFSRVLRNRVLYKDERWLLLALTDVENRDRLAQPQTLVARPGSSQWMERFNPFHVPATPRK